MPFALNITGPSMGISLKEVNMKLGKVTEQTKADKFVGTDPIAPLQPYR